MNANLLSWLERHSLALYFVLAYGFSWSIFIPLALSVQGVVESRLPLALYYLGSFGPMAAATLVYALTRGSAGVRGLLSGLVKWRVGLQYYVFAILAPLGLFAVAVLANRVIAGEWPHLSLLGEQDYLPPIGALGGLGLWLLTYGLGEETGWRGFALPRLQRSHPASSATLILAIFWAFWHLPAFFYRDTYTGMGWLGFPMFLVMLIFTAMVFTWLYNSTGGSLLMVILFHAVFNWLAVSEAGGEFAAIIMSTPVVAWSLFVVRRYGPEHAAPLVRQMV